jgi:ComF family protein
MMRRTAILPGWGRRGLDAALRLFLPERCPACGAVVRGGGAGEPAAVCAACFSDLAFVQGPRCDRCGRPLPEAGASCSCAAGGPIRRRRFALVYGGTAKRLILAFKHADRPDLASRLAIWTARAGADLLAEADLLAPVPVHWSRLLFRQYNQSAELTRQLVRISGRPADLSLLRRRRATPSQGHLSAAARRRNVAHAFAVRPGCDLTGKTVLLIDDVVTTGATAEACAAAVLAAGAVAVDLLTVAAVP